MNKRIITLCIALLCLTLAVMAQDNRKDVTLHIVGTTDVHGAFMPFDFFNNSDQPGSMARVSTFVKQLRSQYGEDAVVLLDNGDILQGQPICYYYNYVKTDVPNIAAQVINYLKYDAETFGNHDVEPGHDVYDKWIKELDCPTLGANIIDTHTGKPYVAPYTIVERQGVRIAVLGMLTPAIPNWLNETLWSGLHFEEMVGCARQWIDYLRRNEQPDLIVGLFHSGWDGGISTPEYDEDAAKKVAEEVEGFDLIFYGHDHRERLEKLPNGVLCLDPSCNAKKVAHATVTLHRNGTKWAVESKQGELVDVCPLEIDTTYVQHFQPAIDDTRNYVNRLVGVLEAPLHSRDCFFGPSPFTDLIQNMQLQLTGADISFSAPLSFNTVIEAGNIYVRDMFKLYRFENRLYTLRMTGEEVRKHLEMSYDLWTNTMKSPEDHILLLDEGSSVDQQRYGFKNLTFNFDSATGIDYEVDVTKPAGEKVRILRMSDGRPFDPKAWYVVAMNSYRGNGGGELLTHGAGIAKDSIQNRILTTTPLDLRYYLTQEIERMGTVNPKANTNWRFVPEAWAEPALRRDRKLLFKE